MMRGTIMNLGGILIIVAIVFGIVSWVGEIPGNYVDWIFGLLAFWWLLVVTIIPWNLYFQSKELLRELKISENKDIEIEEKDRTYLRKSVRFYLVLAIGLHIVSAVGFYLAAEYNITNLGNYAAIIALALTFIRPLIRLYQHILTRLRSIRQRIHFPRKDVVSLDKRVRQLEGQLEKTSDLLKKYQQDFDIKRPDSAFANYYKKIAQMEQRLEEQDKYLKKVQFAGVSAESQDEFMSQVKGIIRFIKDA